MTVYSLEPELPVDAVGALAAVNGTQSFSQPPVHALLPDPAASLSKV